MNRSLTAFLLCMFVPLFLVAQNNYARITHIGSSKNSSLDITRMDGAGNAYFVINTNEDIEVKGMTFKKRGTNYSVIAKIAANGDLVWARTFVIEQGADVVGDVQVDKDQNVYLTGIGYLVKLDNGKTLNAGPYLIKLNKSGETEWGIGPDADQKDVATPGRIALANDGLYWSAAFVSRLRIQDRNIPAYYPASNIAEAYIARVTTTGDITGLYHHPMSGAVVEALKTTKAGDAAAVINGDGGAIKMLIGQNGNVISQKAFFRYSGQSLALKDTPYGYQFFAYDRENTGYFDVRLDDLLDLLGANKVFEVSGSDRITEGMGFDAATAFYIRRASATWVQDWLVSDNGISSVLPAELPGYQGRQVFTRSFMQVVGDTINMLIRHIEPGSINYNFYGKPYKDKANNMDGYFWVKYPYKVTEPCLKLVATVAQNGTEGKEDAVIKVSTPENCATTEDLVINLKLADGMNNAGDFSLPEQLIIKKGSKSAEATIKITDDSEFESDENFDIQLTLATGSAGYSITSGSLLTVKIIDNDNTDANRRFNVTYEPEIMEGASGTVTVSLLPNIKLSEPLTFVFEPDGSPYSASSADFSPLLITLPAGDNSVTIKVDALTDKLIEGDEVISGKISAKPSNYGGFGSNNNNIKINIADVDNTADNRIIEIASNITTLTEGSANTYLFKLAAPYALQYPLNIISERIQWQPFLQQNNSNVQLSQASVTAALTVTYPDDNVIRDDKTIKIGLTAVDPHLGVFRFRWNGQIIDAINMTATDDDAATASLTVSPSVLALREGSATNITIQVAGNKVFENDIALGYNWLGNAIDADKRINNLSVNGITLTKQQNKTTIPVSVENDKQINASNNYTIHLTALDLSGNSVRIDPKSIAVNIVDDDAASLKIPLVFTPNGDGVNDVWNIEGLALDAQSKVNIFDRNGRLIYQSTGYGSAWDGTVKGAQLPVGTYYYRIDGFTRSQAGSVTIIR